MFNKILSAYLNSLFSENLVMKKIFVITYINLLVKKSHDNTVTIIFLTYSPVASRLESILDSHSRNSWLEYLIEWEGYGPELAPYPKLHSYLDVHTSSSHL